MECILECRLDELLSAKEELEAQMKELRVQMANGDRVIEELYARNDNTTRCLPLIMAQSFKLPFQ